MSHQDDTMVCLPSRQSEHAPFFSVIITTYNYGHLIERTLHSLEQQSFRDFEVIVVDDGSTDDTRERLDPYMQSLHYHYQTNSGQCAACNKGIELARGRFIYILDADDELLPEALCAFAKAIDMAGEDAEHSIFYGGYVSVSEAGQERIRKPRPAPEHDADRLKAFLQKKLTGLKHGGFTLPRSAFERLRYPEHVRQNTDLVIIGQALAHYRARPIGEIVLRSHEHPQRVRKQLDRVLKTSMEPVDALFNPRLLPPHLMRLKPLYAGRRLRSIARMLYLNGDYQAASEHYRAAFRAAPSTMLHFASVAKAVKSLLRSARGTKTK